MNTKTKEAGRHGMFAAKTAAPGFNPKDVWRYGGWLLPNTNIVPSVKDEKTALESGAVKFDLDLKGVMQVERKSSDRHTEARMAHFLKKFPPPETLDLKFKSYGADEEDHGGEAHKQSELTAGSRSSSWRTRRWSG